MQAQLLLLTISNGLSCVTEVGTEDAVHTRLSHLPCILTRELPNLPGEGPGLGHCAQRHEEGWAYSACRGRWPLAMFVQRGVLASPRTC